MLSTIQQLESEVRGYVRNFPTVFTSAKGAKLFDSDGREYLDFFAGAGALNYGHNNEHLKKALIEYIAQDGVTHSLDMATDAKVKLLERFNEVVLKPRGLDYKIQFTGPTGTNSVEAALKLARKVTGRTGVLSFTNGFHGMTLGALAVTGNHFKRAGAGVPLAHARSMPFDGYLGPGTDTALMLESMLEDPSSGLEKPAAIIVETIQAEGGVNVASDKWLRSLRRITRKHGVLLIVDDIQVGCGRTGKFFSFEDAGIDPDIVCLSKSLSGYGLPFALTLFRRELDVWDPGEHNGTFRGHNLAMVTATAAMDFWVDDTLTLDVQRKAKKVSEAFRGISESHRALVKETRGRGLIQGLECAPEVASRVAQECFTRGLIIETAGPRDEVLKLLPSLTITDEELKQGLDIIGTSFAAVAKTMRNGVAHEMLAIGAAE